MDISILEVCDEYIVRCEKVLAEKDVKAAKRLRIDATKQFHSLIPRWSSGLMASITQYYLDDIENILAKLLKFRAIIEHDSTLAQAAKPVYCHENSGEQFVYEQKRNLLISSFESTYHWILENYSPVNREVSDVLTKFTELQQIAVQPGEQADKWERMKTILDWIASEQADLAARLLPLVADVMSK